MWSAETVFVCALTLLGRSRQVFPPVEFVDRAPPGVSASAQAYVTFPDAHIVLITSTSAFVSARRSRDRCNNVTAIREIAGVLAHEEWHVRHGPDEEDAYNAQLTALLAVGATQDSALYHKVLNAKQTVMAEARRRAAARRFARERE